MQQNHSPLPWKMIFIDKGKLGWVEDSEGEIVVGLGSFHHQQPDEVDAQFVIQACNNFEALLDACKWICERIRIQSKCSDTRETDYLRSIIAKAEAKGAA